MRIRNRKSLIMKFLAFLGGGSAVVPLLIMIVLAGAVIGILGAVAGSQQQGSQGGSGTLTDEVISYQPTIQKYCIQYEIPDYVSLALAVLQTESGGQGSDPMQCSESPYNLNYPNVPNGITDPDYSIQVGIQYLASCLKAADCKSPSDINGISLALQGYNFGGGYISWALERGGYTPELAVTFSEMKAQQMGWQGYGDKDYVAHVFRYYAIADTQDNGYIAYPIPVTACTITSGYGYRDGKLHKGVDLAAPEGTMIYAAASGTVSFAGFGSAANGYGGYGNVVVIKNSTTYSTLYAHCSKLIVSTGATVKKGDVIALVGNTGDSQGNHCHFEVQVNGTATDPLPYLKHTLKLSPDNNKILKIYIDN